MVYENIEYKAMNAVGWGPNFYNNLEERLPKNISEDHKERTLALLELYGDVIASCSNGRQRKCNFSLPAGKADVTTS